LVSTRRSIGLPLARAEGPDKVTGATQFPADVQLPGTLVGKCLRSPYPYARCELGQRGKLTTALNHALD